MLSEEARLELDLNGEKEHRTIQGKRHVGWGSCEYKGPDLGTHLTVPWTERRFWWPHGMSEKEGLGRVTGARVDRPCGLGHGIEISFYAVGSHEDSGWRTTVV